jgi:hypothetical protein
LSSGAMTVLVQWLWTGQVAKCVLIEEREELEEIPLTPPKGSYAARQAELERNQPTLYASRHVIFAVLKALIPLLGLGAIIWSLLPAVDLPGFFRELFGFQPRPDHHPNNWLTHLVKPLLKSAKWVLWGLPILAALFITLEELEKHQKKRHKSEETSPPSHSE